MRSFIAGDRFTAADIYVGSHICWDLGLKTLFPLEAFLGYIRIDLTNGQNCTVGGTNEEHGQAAAMNGVLAMSRDDRWSCGPAALSMLR